MDDKDKAVNDKAGAPAGGVNSDGAAIKSDGATDATVAPAAPPPPLALKRGSRIQLGFRKGTVDQPRGGGKKPYDVRVTWDGQKYPQFITFRTLELDYDKGRLKVL